MTRIYAAAGTADITPQTAVPLAGSESRTGRFTRVADRLEANALVLRQGGAPIVLVSVDLMFVGRELRSGVLSRLGGSLPEASLFFAASHTHFAPATDDRRPRLGRLDAGYLELACERISELVTRLLGGPQQPATITYHHSRADHAVNRRLRAAWHVSRRGILVGGVVAAPNPLGPRDETVHLLRVSGQDGRPMALVWSYACHPVAFPRPSEVTAEYPGRVRSRLRDMVGAAAPVVFWQGFAGDIRPPELDTRASLGARARRLLLGPRFGRFSGGEWERWAASLAECVGRAALSEGHPVRGNLGARRSATPLHRFVEGAEGGQVTFHRLDLGEEIAVVGISAEVVTEYAPMVRRIFDRPVTIPVGYIDEVYGYLPVARMLGEGGYEASWFLRPFALDGPLRPDIEQSCLAALRDLAAAP